MISGTYKKILAAIINHRSYVEQNLGLIGNVQWPFGPEHVAL